MRLSEELLPCNQGGSLDSVEGYEAHVSTSSSFQGPLPPPNLLRAYNEAFPGCAERIVAMAEAESRERHEASRHERETRRLVIEGDVFSQKTGLILAFLLSVFVVSIGAFLIYTGHLAWGAGIVGFPLITLISLFIYGKRQQSSDLQKMIHQVEEDSPQADLPFPR
jgi:uncharacterized membrane protein